MGIPLLRGRDVTAGDRLGAPGVVVVNEFMAKRYWPNENPIGKRIALDRPSTATPWMTVIGVVKNVVRSDWSAPPAEEIYVAWLQEQNYLTSTGGHVDMSLVVRASCPPDGACDAAALTTPVRNVVWSFDRNVPVSDVFTMDQVETQATARARFTLVLLAAFAVIALVLAAVGVYGVMSYAVSRRMREIGVRLALGASPFTVVRMVVREGMTVAVVGAAVGLVGALVLTRSMASFLYGVRSSDPLTFAGVSIVLLGAALFATYLPARRAARTDPLIALRGD
jgi:predicted permease